MNSPRLLFGFLLAVTLALPADAQPLPVNDDRVHMGVATCAASVCHGSVIPRKGTNVLQNEYVVWSRQDPHRVAFERLRSRESAAIARKMGLGNAWEAEACLVCHADNVAAEQRGDRFRIQDGIGCEACHGGAEDYLDLHTSEAASLEDNIAAGLYPTDRPEARAQLCLSCHMGRPDTMATHDMMAAGHPRLSFELDTFTILQPAHFVIDEDYRERKWHGGNFATWKVGQVASARQSLALIEAGLESGGRFPELALFDCHSCHRAMNDERWRPETHVGLSPGSVRLNDAHFHMILAAAGVLAPDLQIELERATRALHAAAAHGQDIAAAADRLRTLLNRFNAIEVDIDSSGEKLLRAIVSLPAQQAIIDYTTAEQLVMATDMLLSVLNRREARSEWLDAVYAEVLDEDAFDPNAFAEVFAAY